MLFAVAGVRKLGSGQKSWINSITDATFLSCTAKKSKHIVKKNIGQFRHILGPSLGQRDIFDQLNRFLRYYQNKCVTDGMSAFHHLCTFISFQKSMLLIKNICWPKPGPSTCLNCQILFITISLLVLAAPDKMRRQ